MWPQQIEGEPDDEKGENEDEEAKKKDGKIDERKVNKRIEEMAQPNRKVFPFLIWADRNDYTRQ